MQYAVDSRDVEKGSLFFALKGERSDGHCFLEEVKKRGAAGAVISDSYEGDLHHLDTQRVKNVLFELQEKARKKLEKSSALRIGITGSVGKTTTSNFLKTLLSEKFSVTATIKSFNGQIGLPLTILNGDLNVDVLVLELGMNLPGEMARLVEIAPLDYALVTMISESHVGNFEGLDEVAKQKGMVFTSKRLKKGFVSRQASAYFPKQEVIKEIGDSPFQADHLSACFFAAAHVARALGLSDDEITRGAKKLKTSPRRFERCEKKGVVFINDSYNASVASFDAAIRNMPKVSGRTIGVFGSMGELGKKSVEAHRHVGAMAREKFDAIYAIGDECFDLLDSFGKEGKVLKTFDELFAKVKSELHPGDVALIKGKNTWQLWRVFDDF